MRVLFLDIDGVLNNAAFNYRAWADGAPSLGPRGYVDPAAVAVLDRLVDETGAAIVVSSTWRLLDDPLDIERWIKRHGLRESAQFVGVTPHLGRMTSGGFRRHERGEEIRTWLDASGVESYAVVDDDDDMTGVAHRLVQTDWDTGLLESHLPELVRFLNSPIGSLPGDVVGSTT